MKQIKLDYLIISVYIAVNTLLLTKINMTSDLRSGIDRNYVRDFALSDVFIFIALLVGSYYVVYALIGIVIPFIRRKVFRLSDRVISIDRTIISLSKNGFMKNIYFHGINMELLFGCILSWNGYE